MSKAFLKSMKHNRVINLLSLFSKQAEMIVSNNRKKNVLSFQDGKVYYLELSN
jgi:hypothetical protein